MTRDLTKRVPKYKRLPISFIHAIEEKVTMALDEEEVITPFADREMSQISLPSIGEIYEGALDDGVIEGPIEIRPGRRASVGSQSNFSVDSDDVSRMTTDSKKKRRSSRKSRSNKTSSSSKSKRKGSSSGPSYSEVDLENAYRMLEEKDIVVTSLVKQVEELQQQLLENKSQHIPHNRGLREGRP